MAEVYRTPKDVLCLGCKTKFTLSGDEFTNQTKIGAIEEHKFEGMSSLNQRDLAKYTCRDCPHCRKADEGSKQSIARQMATINRRRIELESLGQDRSGATSTAVAEQMAANEREYYR